MRTAAMINRQLVRQAIRYSQIRSLATSTGGQAVAAIAKDFPHMDAVRFLHKNQKFAFKDVDFNAEAIACGFSEQGFQPGDIVLSWLPDYFSEQVILEFACSKAGFVLYKLDPTLATKDPEKAKLSLKSALEITKANILITQEAGSDVSYVRLLKEVIPEVRAWDFSEGLPFLSPRFPHLRYPVHTGFDREDKHGMIPYRHMISPSGDLPDLLAEYEPLNGSTPLYGELKNDLNGIPTSKGNILTNDEVQSSNVWPIYNCILNKEYQEIEGVGNIW